MKPNQKATYLAMIRQLPGVKLFQKMYITTEEGQDVEVTEDGKLSCAFVVTSILTIFGLMDRLHGTVTGTLREAEKLGWQKTDMPTEGDLVLWGEYEGHPHIGFYIGEGRCVSNNTELGVPSEHDLTMKDGREPEYFLTNPHFQ